MPYSSKLLLSSDFLFPLIGALWAISTERTRMAGDWKLCYHVTLKMVSRLAWEKSLEQDGNKPLAGVLNSIPWVSWGPAGSERNNWRHEKGQWRSVELHDAGPATWKPFVFTPGVTFCLRFCGSLRFHPAPHFLTDCHHCCIHHSGNIYQMLSMTQVDITEDPHIRFYVFNIKRNAFHHVSLTL